MTNDAPSFAGTSSPLPPIGAVQSIPTGVAGRVPVSKPSPPEMRYIFVASYKKNDKTSTPAHIGSRNASQMKFFPICGRLLTGNVSDSPWTPRDKRLCPACTAIYSKEFRKAPPWEFKK